jgi:hypothetical protein
MNFGRVLASILKSIGKLIKKSSWNQKTLISIRLQWKNTIKRSLATKMVRKLVKSRGHQTKINAEAPSSWAYAEVESVRD